MDFKTRLRQLRTARHLTQVELARRLDISPAAISMYENGQREPNFETEELIADFFNVDLDYLRGQYRQHNYAGSIVWRDDGCHHRSYHRGGPV